MAVTPFDPNSQQDAQLSQRDRAERCVIVFVKTGRLEQGDYIFTDIIGSIFNYCDIIGLKICRIRQINVK